MLMHQKIQILLRFISKSESKVETKPKKGRPYVYSQLHLLLFFVVMQLKGVHKFKSMAKYIKYHYSLFGFDSPPSRKTLRRRFLQMPGYIRWLLPNIAVQLSQMDVRFQSRIGYVDKSIFKALGGIWHKKHMRLGIIPHCSIDPDASWAKSSYHGWRFGYGLHLIVNHMRFPMAAMVTTASAPDKEQLCPLLKGLLAQIHLIVGDASYRAVRTLQQLWNKLQVFVLTFKPFTTTSKFKKWYNQWIETELAQMIYKKRKSTVEPTFALIKELFDLKGESKLPYKGLAKVQAYLLVCVAAIQMMMVFNIIFNNNIGESEQFKNLIL